MYAPCQLQQWAFLIHDANSFIRIHFIKFGESLKSRKLNQSQSFTNRMAYKTRCQQQTTKLETLSHWNKQTTTTTDFGLWFFYKITFLATASFCLPLSVVSMYKTLKYANARSTYTHSLSKCININTSRRTEENVSWVRRETPEWEWLKWNNNIQCESIRLINFAINISKLSLSLPPLSLCPPSCCSFKYWKRFFERYENQCAAFAVNKIDFAM